MAGGGVTGSLTVTFASEDDAFTEGNGAGDYINPSQPTRINHDKPRSAGTMAHPSCGTIVLPSTSKKSGHAAESIGQIVKGGHFVAVRFNPGRKTSATFVYMAEVISVAEEQVVSFPQLEIGNAMEGDDNDTIPDVTDSEDLISRCVEQLGLLAEERRILLSRSTILQDAITMYAIGDLAHHRLLVTFQGDIGEDVGGLSRELFTTFWRAVAPMYFQEYTVLCLTQR
ncbi:hypothetical protein BSL78_17176 [Apostichopus japonicus]|uniref:HECT domain-containing protein n=1 Tax=Stichopus japonicus TaxID=307972 RepID=A0A2G8KD79_STIJA|nr:hypothetical protein BSL78_17176 [Apostichopus japonicus]